jgi:molybdopterin-guanine dinucleotide biosynthesis protein A
LKLSPFFTNIRKRLGIPRNTGFPFSVIVARRVHSDAEFEGRFSCPPVILPAKRSGKIAGPFAVAMLYFGRFGRQHSRVKRPSRRAIVKSKPLSVEICILAGGLSQRMGHDKSRLRLGGRTMLGQIRATAKALGRPVRIVRRDAVARCGPLGGIYTALKSTMADAVLFLACDMPFVTEGLLQGMLMRFGRRDMALFVQSKGPPGFPFLLRRGTLAIVARHIEEGEFSLRNLGRALKARPFSPPASRRAELRNVNTPEEWARAVSAWKTGRKRGKRKSVSQL